MSRVHSKNTVPELKVRKALHAAGFRYRLHLADLPGKPDIVLPKYRTVVFVNGCLWHWHGCKRSRMPVANREYWERKIEKNIARDLQSHKELEDAGYNVRVIWECQLTTDIDALLGNLTEMRERARELA